MFIKKTGFTLIEMLVTVVIISIALLGIGILQTKALQYSYASYQRLTASVQANDLVERLWAGMCSLPSGMSSIVNEWATDNAGSLTNWSGSVAYNASGNIPTYTITITWQDDKIKYTTSDTSQVTQQLVQTTSIPVISCT